MSDEPAAEDHKSVEDDDPPTPPLPSNDDGMCKQQTEVIRVELPSGETIAVAVDLKTDHADSVKEKLAAKNINVTEQSFLSCKGKRLKHGRRSFSEYKLKSGVRLLLEEGAAAEGGPYVIKVKTPSGEKLKLEKLNPETDTIDTVKDRIEDELDIPQKEQILSLGDDAETAAELSDGTKTLAECKIESKAVLLLKRVPLQLSIEIPPLPSSSSTATTIQLEVDPAETIDDLKKLIAKQVPELPRKKQRLRYKGKDLKLAKRALSAYRLPTTGATLQVEIMKLVSLVVRTDAPKAFKLDIEVSETVSNTQDAIVEKLKAKAETAKFAKGSCMDYILTHKGQRVKDIKAKLADLGVDEGAVIEFHAPINLRLVAWTGDKIPVDKISPGLSVDALKELILQLTKMPIARQSLVYNEIPLEHGKRTLADYHITESGTAVYLKPLTIPISVKSTLTGGKVFNVQLEPTDPMERIKESMESVLNLEPHRQAITYKGKKLSNDDCQRTLTDLRIKKGATVFVDLDTISVRVKLMWLLAIDVSSSHRNKKTADGDDSDSDDDDDEGGVLRLDVEPTHTIAQLKKLVHEEASNDDDIADMPAVNQLFLFVKGKELADDSTLDECKIHNGSWLDLHNESTKQYNAEGPDMLAGITSPSSAPARRQPQPGCSIQAEDGGASTSSSSAPVA